MLGVSLGLGLLNGKSSGRGKKPATAPTYIALSATAVAQDAGIGSVVAVISSNGTAPVSFTLLEAPADISLSTSVASEDAQIGSVVAVISSSGTAPVSFTVLEPPADISLSTTSIPEDARVGSVVAIISAEDSEADFSLVA